MAGKVNRALSVEEAEQLFSLLGIVTYGTDLREGSIEWKNKKGAVVARGKFRAILSYSPANQSWMKAWYNDGLVAAEAAMIPSSEDEPFAKGVSVEEAQEEAVAIAERAQAMFVYRCSFGESSLLIAVDEVEVGPTTAAVKADREKACRDYVGKLLAKIAPLIKVSPIEGGVLLTQLERAAEQQAIYVVAGTPTATKLKELNGEISQWREMSPETAEREIKKIAADWMQ
jgi:hypothetical protein